MEDCKQQVPTMSIEGDALECGRLHEALPVRVVLEGIVQEEDSRSLCVSILRIVSQGVVTIAVVLLCNVQEALPLRAAEEASAQNVNVSRSMRVAPTRARLLVALR